MKPKQFEQTAYTVKFTAKYIFSLQAMGLAGLQEINIFAAELHSHLLGRGLTVRHVRLVFQYRLIFRRRIVLKSGTSTSCLAIIV